MGRIELFKIYLRGIIMEYIFLAASIWNFWGGINFIFMPEKQGETMGYSIGNMWESHYAGGMAFFFGVIYFIIFYSPPQGYLFFIPFFAVAKYWVFISSVICYKKYNMPKKFMLVFGGSNLLFAVLFTGYYLTFS